MNIFYINGVEISINGKVNDQPEIDIINGPDILLSIKRDGLSRQIAVLLKNALQDKNEYDTYAVLFVKQKRKGVETFNAWKAKSFNSSELQLAAN